MLDLLVRMEDVLLDDSSGPEAVRLLLPIAELDSECERTRLFCALLLGCVHQKHPAASGGLQRLLLGQNDKMSLAALFAFTLRSPLPEFNNGAVPDVSVGECRRAFWYFMWRAYALEPILKPDGCYSYRNEERESSENDQATDVEKELDICAEDNEKDDMLPSSKLACALQFNRALDISIWNDIGLRVRVLERIRSCSDSVPQAEMLRLLPDVSEKLDLAMELYWRPDSDRYLRAAALSAPYVRSELHRQANFYAEVVRHETQPNLKAFALSVLSSHAADGVVSPEAVEALLRSEYTCSHGEPEVLTAILRGMGRLPRKSAIDFLLGVATQTRDTNIRTACYAAIGRPDARNIEILVYRAKSILTVLGECSVADIPTVAESLLRTLNPCNPQETHPDIYALIHESIPLLEEKIQLIPDDPFNQRAEREGMLQRLRQTFEQIK